MRGKWVIGLCVTLGFAPHEALASLCSALPQVPGSVCLDKAVPKDVTAFSECKTITNNHASGLNVFVPTNSLNEWNSFLAHPPVGVSVAACAAPPPTGCGAATVNRCSLSAVASGSSSGTCASGSTGSCSYSCSGITWSLVSNTCTPNPVVIYLTSGTTFSVPSDWNNANNSIEVIGGGGASSTPMYGSCGGGGGGGGAYSKVTNVALTAGATVGYSIGIGGATPSANGGVTYFCNALSCTGGALGANVVVSAAGGSGAPASLMFNRPAGAGGLTTSGKGTVKFGGGSGGQGMYVGGGGGGAAGPYGAGGLGAGGVGLLQGSGGQGGGTQGGAGGIGPHMGGAFPSYIVGASGPDHMAGTAGSEWSSAPLRGSGGGGAGGSPYIVNACYGAPGANFGAGGGGDCMMSATGQATKGAQGIIRIQYTPVP